MLRAMPLEIRIDREACRGAGECVFRAPGSFALDDADRAVVRGAGDDPDARIVEAARACPHFAIQVLRDGERVV